MTDEYDFRTPNAKIPVLYPADIEKIKGHVSRYFRVYDTRWSDNTAAFYFTLPSDLNSLEDHFETLRVTLKNEGYIPRLVKEAGEYIIYVVHSPSVKKRGIWINILLIIATIFTTTWAGAILWFGRTNVEEGADFFTPIVTPDVVLFGFLSFALPLMVILGTHETAHYLAAKRHNIDASLPYFIPLPPFFLLGTMGAFISMREPISNKKALLDIGAAGPIAGFIVSLPILLIGFFLESIQPASIAQISESALPSQIYIFNEPLLFSGLRAFFPTSGNNLMHPTVFAGWVGLFVTALNLLPGGQLDGGHIARALMGKSARYLSFMVILILFFLSFYTQFFGWIVFAFIILLLGTAHPPPLNDITRLGPKRQAIGAFCMVMLLVCIHYSPITIEEIEPYDVEFICDSNYQVVDINETAVFHIEALNSGDSDAETKFDITYESPNSDTSLWTTDIRVRNSRGKVILDYDEFEWKGKEGLLISVNITPSPAIGYGGLITHTINLTLYNGIIEVVRTYSLSTRVGSFYFNTTTAEREEDPQEFGKFDVTINNLLDINDSINLTYDLTTSDLTPKRNWTITLPVQVIHAERYQSAVDSIILTLMIDKDR
jgi:membrane-associated protease RseP (regulator of RpoE activity)